MCYIITDGEHYINTTGGYNIVNYINQATQFKKDKANNVKDHMPKKFKIYNWKIEYAQVKNDTIQQVVEPKEINYSIPEKIGEIEQFAKDMHERQLYLQSKLHNVELEIVDIEHAAEFYNLNASQGYKIYKMLHDRQNERREIKNEMTQIDLIFKHGSMMSALNNNISHTISGLDNRQYTPRVLKELFNI
jgi:hypothetical protein